MKQEEIKEKVVNDVIRQSGKDDIKPETILIAGGIELDSLDMVELAMKLEETFKIKIPDEDMSLQKEDGITQTYEGFQSTTITEYKWKTVQDIINYIETKL
jgi:acyl carrier protein